MILSFEFFQWYMVPFLDAPQNFYEISVYAPARLINSVNCLQ